MKKNENTFVRGGQTLGANGSKEGSYMTNETIQKVQAWLADDAAALVISPENRYWLTGYFSTDGTVLVTKQKAYFFIDFRYIEKAREVVPFCEIILAERGGVDAAEVHGEKIAFFDLFIGRHTVGQRGIFTRHHDEFKGSTLTAELADIKFHIEHDLTLGATGFDALADIGKGLIGERLRPANSIEFARRFDGAVFSHETVEVIGFL